MKFSIDRDYLLNNLNNSSRALSNKPQMPILTGIKIEAKDDVIIFTTSNNDISIKITLDNSELMNISSKGTVVLPAATKLVAEICNVERPKSFTLRVLHVFSLSAVASRVILPPATAFPVNEISDLIGLQAESPLWYILDNILDALSNEVESLDDNRDSWLEPIIFDYAFCYNFP